MEDRSVKFYSKDSNNVVLRAIPGHFATSHSHINYYIDMTALKSRCKEAQEVAKVIAGKYVSAKQIDTIICMDGTEVVGAYLAQNFEKNTYMTTKNRHDTIYLVTPEFNASNQMIFRDNSIPAVQGKHVLLLLATTTTGVTIRRSLECIEYYGGIVEGIASIFSTVDQVHNKIVESVFTQEDLPGYAAYEPEQCPFCKKNHKIEAMVNGYGYSKL